MQSNCMLQSYGISSKSQNGNKICKFGFICEKNACHINLCQASDRCLRKTKRKSVSLLQSCLKVGLLQPLKIA